MHGRMEARLILKSAFPLRVFLSGMLIAASSDVRMHAAERSAELQAILKIAAQANQRVRNFSCVSRAFHPMDHPEFPWKANVKASPIVEKSPDGLALVEEYSITIDRVGHRYLFEGRTFAAPENGPPYFRSENAAFDGNLYRTYSSLLNSGLQKLYRPEYSLSANKSLHSFLGDAMGGDAALVAGGDLTYWLNQPDGWSFESQLGASLPRIKRFYRTKAYDTEMRLHVTFSPDHDYLPLLIETYFCDTETMNDRLKVEQFHQVMPEGIWVPVRGRFETYYRKAINPPGITDESYEQMSRKEKDKVDPLFRFEARLMAAPALIVIDPRSIKLNQGLSDTTFVLEYPPSVIVWDEKSQEPLLQGKDPLPETRKVPSVANNGLVLDKTTVVQVIVGVVASGLAILLFAIRRRRGSGPVG